MVEAFQAQGYFGRTQYLPEIPVACSQEFDFYRCVEFSHSMYGKTVSELHAGNLRLLPVGAIVAYSAISACLIGRAVRKQQKLKLENTALRLM